MQALLQPERLSPVLAAARRCHGPSPEKTEDHTEDNAENDRRHDGKVEDEVAAWALLLDVSRQQRYGRRLVALIRALAGNIGQEPERQRDGR